MNTTHGKAARPPSVFLQEAVPLSFSVVVPSTCSLATVGELVIDPGGHGERLVWGTWENKAMQRKRDGLVPIGEVFSGLDGR